MKVREEERMNLGTQGKTISEENLMKCLLDANKILSEQRHNKAEFSDNKPSSLMRWVAKNCRWRWRFGIYNCDDKFRREFRFGCLKFTSVPPRGELITRKYYKGFLIALRAPLITWRKFEFNLGNIGKDGEVKWTPAFGIRIRLVIPIKVSFRNILRIW